MNRIVPALLISAILSSAPAAVAEPYTETYQMEGFLSCGANLVAVGVMACSIVPGDSATFVQEITLSGTPRSFTTALTWDATTPASQSLRLIVSRVDDTLSKLYDTQGPSPLAADLDAGLYGLAAGDELMVRAFPGDMIPLDCIDRPVLGGCTMGVGAAFMQPFTITTTVHYA